MIFKTIEDKEETLPIKDDEDDDDSYLNPFTF